MKLLVSFVLSVSLDIVSASTAAKPQGLLKRASDCFDTCNPDDEACKLACVLESTPNDQRATNTFDCALSCDEASDDFSTCIQECIQVYFLAATPLSSSQVTPSSSNPSYANASSQTLVGSALAPKKPTAGSDTSLPLPAQTIGLTDKAKQSSAASKSRTIFNSSAAHMSLGMGALHISVSEITPFALWFGMSLFLL